MSPQQLFIEYLSVVFHEWTEDVHFWQEFHRNGDVSSVYHIMGLIHDTDVSYYWRFDLDHLVKVLSARFLHPVVAFERGKIENRFFENTLILK